MALGEGAYCQAGGPSQSSKPTGTSASCPVTATWLLWHATPSVTTTANKQIKTCKGFKKHSLSGKQDLYRWD